MARNARAPDPCTERRDRQTADSAPAQRTTATSMTADARRRFSALRRNHWRRGALSHKGACVSHIRGPRLNYRLRYWLSTGRLSVRPFIASDEVWAMVRGNDTPQGCPRDALASWLLAAAGHDCGQYSDPNIRLLSRQSETTAPGQRLRDTRPSCNSERHTSYPASVGERGQSVSIPHLLVGTAQDPAQYHLNRNCVLSSWRAAQSMSKDPPHFVTVSASQHELTAR